MLPLIGYYLGRTLQLLGLLTAVAALLLFNDDMGEMMKIAFAGLVEFYLGYGLMAMTGRRG
ncbi:MAG: hypothetical protein HQK87_11100 [Nitrospinae bacterium]|nr:hypothetical protein [Nitrospinota bacterium]